MVYDRPVEGDKGKVEICLIGVDNDSGITVSYNAACLSYPGRLFARVTIDPITIITRILGIYDPNHVYSLVFSTRGFTLHNNLEKVYAICPNLDAFAYALEHPNSSEVWKPYLPNTSPSDPSLN